MRIRTIRLMATVLLGAAFALTLSIAFAQGITLSLSPQSGFTSTGTATLEPVGNQTRVMVTIRGAMPGTTSNGHFHTGACANPGPIVNPLQSINVGADGTGSSTTLVNASLASLQDGNHLVQFHAPTGEGMTCADVPAAAAATPVTTPAAATPVATPAAAVTPTPVAAALPAAGGPTVFPVIVAGAAALGLGFALRRR